jgi:hypothetical protein
MSLTAWRPASTAAHGGDLRGDGTDTSDKTKELLDLLGLDFFGK